jgi:hypothetical protein
MQNWISKWSRIEVRFAAVVLAITLIFATLFVEPVLVRVFGTPLRLSYQSDVATAGVDVYATLSITQVPFDELPMSLQEIYAMDDFDAAIERFSDQTYYITLREVDGVHVRDEVVLTPVSTPYITATFDWFLTDRNHIWNDNDDWQDRYLGITLQLETVQRFVLPADISASQRQAIVQGTATAIYHLYQNKLYLIHPLG